MSLLNKITGLLRDPGPEIVFEISEGGIAWARRLPTAEIGFEGFEPGVVQVSPLTDNVLQPLRLAEAVDRLAPPNGKNRRRPAVLILPDYCGRVTVLDFDSFPKEPHEQMALVRFRVKKSVPFDLDSASVSYSVQPHPGGSKRFDVVVAVVSLEILARYEAPFRAAGLHPGEVTISSLAALNLVPAGGLEVSAKLSGRVLNVSVMRQGALGLFRCVELAALTMDEILGVFFPTFAFVEDEMKARPQKMLLSGFGAMGELMAEQLQQELAVTVEPLRSRFGIPGPQNAGLYGYLQQAGEAWAGGAN